MKTCSKCDIDKPKVAFNKDSRARNGLKSYCKICQNESHRRYLATPEGKAKHNKSCHQWQNTPEGKAKKNKYTHKYRATPKGKEVQKNSTLKYLYGITLEQYNDMLEAQGNVCAICGIDKPGNNFKHFIVDHDHTTGEVRGLLCNRCNRVLGNFKDDIRVILRMAQYLLQFNQIKLNGVK